MVDSGLLEHAFVYRSNNQSQPLPIGSNVTTIFTREQLTELHTREDQDRSRVSRGATLEQLTNSGEVDMTVQQDPLADDDDSESDVSLSSPIANNIVEV